MATKEKIAKLEAMLNKLDNLKLSVEANKGPKSYIEIIETIKEGLVVAHRPPSRSQAVLLNTIAKQYPIKVREIIDPKTGKKKFTGKITNDKTFCEGWNVVFTGFRNGDWEDMVKERGGKVQKGVNKSTTHVIAKSTLRKTGKLKKGMDVGAAIVNMDNFLTLFEEK